MLVTLVMRTLQCLGGRMHWKTFPLADTQDAGS
jgi:hypothetical protein